MTTLRARLRPRRPSLRGSVLLIVVAVALAPLLLAGLWLSGSTARSGEALLAERLRGGLRETGRALEVGWVRHRSDLLDLGEAMFSLRAGGASEDELRTQVAQRLTLLDPAVMAVTLRDASGAPVLEERRADVAAGLFGPPFTGRVAILDRFTGRTLGSAEMLLPLQAMHRGEAVAAGAGGVLTAFDRATGAVLLPTPFDPELLRGPRFQWDGEEWLVLRHALTEPAIELVAAAPLTPFTGPFDRAARQGAAALLVVGLLATLLATVLTGRVTASVERLASAADDVAAGRFEQRVDEDGSPEISRVARAFNAMTANLRATLAQLTERESLAAVNEFAASLAHEVRNPLSSIQLDLQEVEERLPRDSPLRPLQAQALADVRRLERTVAGALETARSGRVEPGPIDLREPLTGAVHAAAPAHEERGVRIDLAPLDQPLVVHGDPDALHRVFLNLLRNAAEASAAGGETRVEAEREDGGVRVRVIDRGAGISADALARVFDPFYTSRPGGTGLGLPIARRIVVAHRGRITLDSEPGTGTTAEVWLPSAPAAAAT